MPSTIKQAEKEILKGQLQEYMALKDSFQFKLDQACLRVAHYEESLSAIDEKIEQLNDKIELSPGEMENKLNRWISRLSK